MTRRLILLEERRRRQSPPPPPSGFDPARLSSRQQFELDRLLAHLDPVGPEDRALGPLTDGQRARLDELMAVAHGLTEATR